METRNQGKRRTQTQLPCCRNGQCPTCTENARWERIFKEKFADPFYYAPKLARSGSPIRDF